MRTRDLRPIGLALFMALAIPSPGGATDVDGPNDCQRVPVDFGDAPEGVMAYPGVPGRFPTCTVATPPGDQDVICSPGGMPIGPTGFVRHTHLATSSQYWLGCPLVGIPPMGIDDEPDGKMNDTGAPVSACSPAVAVDCTEAAFGMTFGQDECFGGNDAGLAADPGFLTCTPASLSFRAYFCGPGERQVFLNVLVDWNHDGDWNDEAQCGPAGGCTQEWVVQNRPILLVTGCNTINTPPLMPGNNPGPAWMRITISDGTAPPDFSWNGSASLAGQSLLNGETEDYPIAVRVPPPPCPSYQDFGDAPEQVQAYPGVPGHFPTCFAPSAPGTQEFDCPPISSPPSPLGTGFVRHLSSSTDNFQFWLGCGDGVTTLGVDGEQDGKMNDTGAPLSFCNQGAVDCTEFLGVPWAQDECYGDLDAGLAGPRLTFKACQTTTVDFHTFNCKQQVDAFLNILVDMNEDGDWNDNFQCSAAVGCAYEWAVRNVPIPLAPGCQLNTSPAFLVGPRTGKGWLRITITPAPVSNDFPWDGSAGPGGDGAFFGGETEDYPVVIQPDNVGVGDSPRLDRLSLSLAPNPAKNQVAVQFVLPRAEQVSLAAYDLAGRKLVELANRRMDAGAHRVTWDFVDRRGRPVAAGYYVIKLRVGNEVLTQRGIRVQ